MSEAADLKQLVARVRERFGEGVDVKEALGQTAFLIRPELLVPLARYLRDEEGFRLLTDIGGVDNLRLPDSRSRFEVVYHLTDVRDLGRVRSVRIRVLVPEESPRVPTLTGLWPGANWPEREVYDLFGVVFEGHPDLRRILLPDDYEGHPLRKDFPLYGLQPDPPLARE